MSTNTGKLLSGVSAKLKGVLVWNRDLCIYYYAVQLLCLTERNASTYLFNKWNEPST